MEEALRLAKLAAEQGEVPVGAIVVKDGKIIGSGYNLRETNHSATAHAELIAIEDACRKVGDWRLTGATLYVTLEPCPMCAGAIVNSRIERVVYGAKDATAGCCGSILNLNTYPFTHAFSLQSGICEEECRMLLQSFFEKRRFAKMGEN
jgi:tRNA(adenine34) deaminase